MAISLNGRLGIAEHDDPVVKNMRAITIAHDNKRPPRQRDLDQVSAWLDAWQEL